VLYTEIDALLQITVSDSLFDDYSDGSWGDVVYYSCSSMVVFVGHTLLLGSVRFNIYNVTNTVRDDVGGHLDGAMVLERPRKHMARTRAVSVRVRHFELRGLEEDR